MGTIDAAGGGQQPCEKQGCFALERSSDTFGTLLVQWRDGKNAKLQPPSPNSQGRSDTKKMVTRVSTLFSNAPRFCACFQVPSHSCSNRRTWLCDDHHRFQVDTSHLGTRCVLWVWLLVAVYSVQGASTETGSSRADRSILSTSSCSRCIWGECRSVPYSSRVVPACRKWLWSTEVEETCPSPLRGVARAHWTLQTIWLPWMQLAECKWLNVEVPGDTIGWRMGTLQCGDNFFGQILWILITWTLPVIWQPSASFFLSFS